MGIQSSILSNQPVIMLHKIAGEFTVDQYQLLSQQIQQQLTTIDDEVYLILDLHKAYSTFTHMLEIAKTTDHDGHIDITAPNFRTLVVGCQCQAVQMGIDLLCKRRDIHLPMFKTINDALNHITKTQHLN